jgi:hypothetical protein
MYLQAIEINGDLRRRGHLNSLLKALWDCGFTVKVPNPLPGVYKI